MIVICWEAAPWWAGGMGKALAAIAIALWLTVPRRTSLDCMVDQLSAERIGRVVEELRQPTLALVGIILFLYMLIWQMFSAFYPAYLIIIKGLSPATASRLFSLFFAVGVLIKPVNGMAYDRIGMRRSLPIVLGGSIVGFATLPLTTELWRLVIVTILIGTMFGSGASVMFSNWYMLP